VSDTAVAEAPPKPDWYRENDDLSGVVLKRITCVDDIFELKRWAGERRPVMGLDVETGGFDWWRDRLRTVQLGDANTGWCIDAQMWLGVAKEIIEAYEGDLTLANFKFDLHFLEHNGVKVPRGRIHDVRAMGHLLDPVNPTGLKPQSERYIHRGAGLGQATLKTAFHEQGWTFDTVPIEFGPYWQYAAFDPVLTARLDEKHRPRVMAEYRDVYELEVAATMVLLDMEKRGARIDRTYCRDMIGRLEPYLDQQRAWIRLEFGVANPGSDKQVIKRLHEYGFSWEKKTEKGNVACDKEVLSAIPHPLAAGVLAYRDAIKLCNTYLKNFDALADGGDMLHAAINPLGARTGRMSISRPSMQNLPRSQHPRNAVIARDGHTLVLADFDQIEMRLLAHFAREERMLEAIRYGDQMTEAGHSGYDVHSMNARGIYGLGPDEVVPKAMRDVTKNSGFAKIYGAGIAQFARTAGISEDDARSFLELYDVRFPGVKRFQGEIAGVAVGRGRAADDNMAWVTSPIGRRHPCELNKVYKLCNYLIQGTAADVFKRALVNVDLAGLGEYLILPVHDELIADVPNEVVEEYARLLPEVMTDRTGFAVPLTCDVELTPRWGTKYIGAGDEIWVAPDLEEAWDPDAPENEWMAA
jgi:DNA polymerase-1